MEARQLRQLMPRNAQDVGAAEELVSLGAEALGAAVPEMLRRMKDHDSPVADVYCTFFAESGEQFVDEIHRVLTQSTMPELTNKIVSRVLPNWSRGSIERMAGTLQMLVSRTNVFDTDLLCIRLLAKHNLADREWLRRWLDFKRDRLRYLSQLGQDIDSELG
jgi:hypothetical protein